MERGRRGRRGREGEERKVVEQIVLFRQLFPSIIISFLFIFLFPSF